MKQAKQGIGFAVIVNIQYNALYIPRIMQIMALVKANNAVCN
jgi:hypothetical protein